MPPSPHPEDVAVPLPLVRGCPPFPRSRPESTPHTAGANDECNSSPPLGSSPTAAPPPRTKPSLDHPPEKPSAPQSVWRGPPPQTPCSTDPGRSLTIRWPTGDHTLFPA